MDDKTKNNFNKKNLFIILIILAFLICLLIIFFTIFNKKENDVLEKKVDALSYKMELNLDTNQNSLSEVVKIEVKNNTEKEISELCIRDMTPAILKYNKENYSPENDSKSTKIDSITLNEKDEELDIITAKDDSAIYIKLSENEVLKPSETTYITIKMKTDIPDRADRFGVVEKKAGKLYTLSFCFPYLADNIDGEWITDPYFDDGESRSYDLANYEVIFTAPESFKVAATGNSITENGKTNINAENVRDFAIVACDFMNVDTFDVEGIRINNYYLDSENSRAYRKLTKLIIEDSLKIYTEKIGKYPYRELDIAPCLFGFSFGGMEYPGLIMTNATSFYEGDMADAWSLSDGLSHEIGHQWFYATVGNREYTEGWIDESFTTYLERDLYGLSNSEAIKYLEQIDEFVPSLEKKIKDRDALISTARKDYEKIYLNTPPSEYDEGQSYGEAEYECGYMFLQEVRIQLGDERFSQFLKDYYEEYYLKKVTTQDIIDFIKRYDDSEKMQDIINFYFKES